VTQRVLTTLCRRHDIDHGDHTPETFDRITALLLAGV
jgi:hypothetical protein